MLLMFQSLECALVYYYQQLSGKILFKNSGVKPCFTLYAISNFWYILLFSSESQPISLYSLRREVDLVKPVTIRAALCWIFSILSFSYWVHPSQTIQPYSKIGLKNEIYICWRAFLLTVNLIFHIIPNTFEAELKILCICSTYNHYLMWDLNVYVDLQS